MFTGLIQHLGRLGDVESRGDDVRLQVIAGDAFMTNIAVGDSIAVNGVCLTAVELAGDRFVADLSRETLDCTTAGAWVADQPVNLEPALRAGDPLGGHLVSGHVDGVGVLVDRADDARSVRMQFEAPEALARFIAAKGSIAIDGISLTVNTVEHCRFGVNIVPHTLEHTTLGDMTKQHRVNLEVDVLARYLERMLQAREEGL